MNIVIICWILLVYNMPLSSYLLKSDLFIRLDSASWSLVCILDMDRPTVRGTVAPKTWSCPIWGSYSLQWYLLGQVEATKQLICHLVSQPESKTSTTCCSNELHNLVDLESSMAFSSMFQSICRPVIPVIQSSIRPPRIHTKATQPLWELGMNFGARFAYDSAQCAGPWSCDLNYQRFGSLSWKLDSNGNIASCYPAGVLAICLKKRKN